MSLSEFIEMGGYGKYVWSCYGISFVALALNIILPKMKEKKTLLELKNKLNSEVNNKK